MRKDETQNQWLTNRRQLQKKVTLPTEPAKWGLPSSEPYWSTNGRVVTNIQNNARFRLSRQLLICLHVGSEPVGVLETRETRFFKDIFSLSELIPGKDDDQDCQSERNNATAVRSAVPPFDRPIGSQTKQWTNMLAGGKMVVCRLVNTWTMWQLYIYISYMMDTSIFVQVRYMITLVVRQGTGESMTNKGSWSTSWKSTIQNKNDCINIKKTNKRIKELHNSFQCACMEYVLRSVHTLN